MINKQKAIDAIEFEKVYMTAYKNGINEGNLFEQYNKGLDDAIKAINNLAPAEPERKKGKWVPVINGRGGFECDQCHNYAPSYKNGDEYLSYFCPHCGAEM